MDKCPKCESPNPKHHPAVQWEGEVHLCRDPWHKPSAEQIEAEWVKKEAAPERR